MMFKNIFFILISFSFLYLFNSCTRKNEYKSFHLQKGFISEPGTYYWNSKKIIIIKNIDNAGKIFAVLDKKRNVIYQQPINRTFTNFHYHRLFIEGNNLFYYNSDIGENIALIWNNDLSKYDTIKNFCSKKIHLPKELKEELKPHLDNCISLE